MFWELYALIVLLGAGASACLWLVRPTRPVFGFAAGALWALAALQARNISAYSNGTEIAVGSEAWQYVCLGLSLISIATVVLWHAGVYPPVEESDDVGAAEIPGEAARMEDTP